MSRISNFPNGFANGITIRGVPLSLVHPGKVFWVNNSTVLRENGSSANNNISAGTYQNPFSTIDFAINQCVASRGDIIIVGPGHAETVTATSIVMDVAGVAIVGIGDGALKPTLSFNATTSNIVVSGANCYIGGIKLLATIDSVVAGLTVSGSGFTCDIETADTSAAIEFISAIVTTATADNLNIKARHRGFVAGNAMTRYIDIVGCRDAIIDVDFFGIASTAVVNLRTTACDNIRVTGKFYNESAALTKNVVNSTTSTWSVEGFDAKGGLPFAGSDDLAVAYLSTGTSTALGTDGTTVTDSATTVLGAIGANSANNSFDSSSVVSNKDGSVLERLEALMDPTGAYDPALGFRVTKTSNLADGSGTDNLFTVTGSVLVTLVVGEVTTVIATTTTMKLRDVTNSVDLCAATTITDDADGTMYLLTGIASEALNGTITPVIGVAYGKTGDNAPLILGNAGGSSTIAHVLDGAGTGAVLWTLYYKPLSAGATVAAAA